MRLKALSALWVIAPSPGYADSPPPRPHPPRPPAAACALRAGDVLTGTYYCAQGWTRLTLRVRDQRATSLRVEFVFRHDASGAAGRYTLTGRCEADGRVRLAPEAWIDRPAGYIMVGMDGIATSAGFDGRISHEACGAFTLRRG